ncbi:hypothetical protein MIMGU_mgv1a024878mg [Erythranthe guttata]|uniref:Uncharacterized protein n=1 Tax=Erythranthe guttata TaxID=4155 RepID=A0A022QPL3_ERYGU|nr:hypothetical protein MIMGU_mgv1a024878mg [Erythranthe guttata]
MHLVFVCVCRCIHCLQLQGLLWGSVVFNWSAISAATTEVRVNKENRAAGILDNFDEGHKYKEHALRKYVRNRKPEIMPSLNSFFTDPQNN